MQIGERFPAPATGGAMSIDAMPLVDRLAARAATAAVPRTRDAGTARPSARTDALRAPSQVPTRGPSSEALRGTSRDTLRNGDFPYRGSTSGDKEAEASYSAGDAASPMYAMWWVWQPPRFPDAPSDVHGGAAPVHHAEAEAASASALGPDRSPAHGDQRHALSALAEVGFAAPASRSTSSTGRDGIAGTVDTPPVVKSLHPAIDPNPPKPSDRLMAQNPLTTTKPTARIETRLTPLTSGVGATADMDPATHPASDVTAPPTVGAGTSAAMTARRSAQLTAHAAALTDPSDAQRDASTLAERETAQASSDGAMHREMPVASANDGLQREWYPTLSAQNAPMPAAPSSRDPHSRPDAHAPSPSPDGTLVSPTSSDAQTTRLSVPFNSWASPSRVELSLGANESGMPLIRMQPSSDGVRQALEQAWPTASADWALDTRDDGTRDRRHAKSPEPDDESEENA